MTTTRPHLSIHDEYPLLNNVSADLRNAGYPSAFNPIPQGASAPRLNMLGSHLPQALIIDGCEQRNLFAGTEPDLGEQEFNLSRRDNPVQILEVIPKYSGMSFHKDGGAGSQIPRITVLCRDLKTGKIGYFHVDRYFRGTDDFGHLNVWSNINTLEVGNVITPDLVLSTSPAHKGPAYCLGVNANTVYMTLPEGIEDAMLISRSLAKKMTSTQISRVVINVKPDSRILNTYGDEDDYRILPIIGEKIRDDGILFASRPTSCMTYAADVDPESLMKIRDMQDTLYTVKKNGIVVDLEFFVNRQRASNHPYTQIDAYQRATEEYWRKIIDGYRKHCKVPNPPEITNELNNLVNTAMIRLLAMGASVPGFNAQRSRPDLEGINGQPVDYIQIVVTYMAKREVQKGFKITDSYGGKGVIGRIAEDEHMPTDQQGIRADLMACSASPFKRMIFSPLYEQGINRGSELVRRRAKHVLETQGADPAFDMLCEWYSDVNPNYGALVREIKNTPEKRAQHVKTATDTFPDVFCPPFLEHICLAFTDALKKKWDIVGSPVTFSIPDPITGGIRTYTTRVPCYIGSKYVYLLCKIPKATSAGIAHMSHQGTPIKPTNRDAKYQVPVNEKPVKEGEDENRIAIGSVPVEIVLRHNALLAKSPVRGVGTVTRAFMLSDHPTAIERFDVDDATLQQSDAVAGIFHHATGVIGIDSRNTLTDEIGPEALLDASDVLGLDNVISSDYDQSTSRVKGEHVEKGGSIFDEDGDIPRRRGRKPSTDKESDGA